MSRSRKKLIGGRYVRTYICCMGDTMPGKWKRRYNRAIRRTQRQTLNKIDTENLEDDETYLETNKDRSGVSDANSWASPGDGRYLWNPEHLAVHNMDDPEKRIYHATQK